MRLWLLIALNFGCMGVLFLLARFDSFSWITAGEDQGASPTTVKISQAIYTLMLFLVPAMIFANAVFPERFQYFKLNRQVRIAPMIVGMFAILSSVFFVDVLYGWNKSWITDPSIVQALEENTAATNWMMQMPGIGDLLLCLLVNALVPAFAEEVFFRGGIQQLLMAWVKKPAAAIILSAAFFSFLHFDPTGFLVRFMLGIFLGAMFYWSGSLRLSIAAHFVFNAFEVINYYWVQHHPDSAWAKMETTYVLGAISLVVSVGALLTCRNLLKKKTAIT